MHGIGLLLLFVLGSSAEPDEAAVPATLAMTVRVPRFEPERGLPLQRAPAEAELPPIDVLPPPEPVLRPPELPESDAPRPDDVPALEPLPEEPQRERLVPLRVRISLFASPPRVPALPPAPAVSPASAPMPRVRAAQPAPAPRAARLRATAVPPLLRYYPEVMRRRGIEGRVLVRVTVDARGAVIGATVLTSSGHRALDQAALRLVRDTRFAPPGAPASGRLPVRFRLQ